MKDSDEGDRVIHCNSNRIGFLNQSGSWGAWCDDTGNWRTGNDMHATYFYGTGSIRLGDMWSGAGLYRPDGNMVFGIENSDWVFSSRAVTQAYFAGGDGNLWMRWAGDWLSNLLAAKAASSHTHSIANVTGLQSALDGKLSTSGKAADSEAVDGVDSSRIVFGDGARASTNSGSMDDPNQKSGFHFAYNPTGRPYVEYWNWITIAGNSWQSSNNYSFQLAHDFHSDSFQVRRMTNGSAAGWREVITSGNIGSQSVSSASSAARATRANGNFYVDDNYGNTIVGVYASTRLQGVWAMGDAYKLAADGSSASNHYGIAWSHPNAGGSAARLTSHGMLIQAAGNTWTAISDSIWCIGDITAFSDARVKTNIEVIDNPLERLSKVRGVTFNRTDLERKDKRYAGVIAQEMREALPEVVTEDGNGELSVSYGNTVSLLIESIKAQQVQIEELKAEVKKLRGE